MGIIAINSNIASLNARRRLDEGSQSLAKTFERLSSGQRINCASDDAAGLAISSSLTAKARRFQQSQRNVNDAISALNIADGATSQLSQILTRMEELATQSANGVFQNSQRQALNTEAHELQKEYNRIVSTTEFNGIKLIDEHTGQITIQAGFTDKSALLSFNTTNLETGNVGNGSFSLKSVITVASAEFTSIVSNDFNSDGKIDLIAGGGSSICLRLGNGDGSFQSPVMISGLDFCVSLTDADMNQDGNVDLVVSAVDGSINGKVGILYGAGNGTFSPMTTLASGEYLTAYSLNVADLNEDGRLDIVTDGGCVGPPVLILSDKAGGYSKTELNNNGLCSYSLKTGDLDGDGHTDLVFQDWDHLDIRWGKGDGTFAKATLAESVVPVGNHGIALTDINGDGRKDIVLADATGGPMGTGDRGRISILSQTGNRTFSAENIVQFTDVGFIHSINIDDVNGDGIKDIIAGGETALGIAYGSGGGSFSRMVSFSIYSDSGDMIVADLNNDGVKDISAVDYYDKKWIVSMGGATAVSSLNTIDLSSRSGSLRAIDYLKKAIDTLSSSRGKMGAAQSRLEVALQTVGTMSENFSAAAGRIMDADIAQESSVLLMRQIQQQASSAVLAQANQTPRIALELLR